jgi:hypothetical protein
MSADLLIEKLKGVQGKGPRWRAICPAHPSKNNTRTLSIFETSDGRTLLKCFAGCGVEEIVGAVGLELTDLFPPQGRDDERGPRVRKPWSNRECAQALETPLCGAFMLLRKVAAGSKISKEERTYALEVAEACSALLLEITR